MDLFENSSFGRLDPSNFGMWVNIDKAILSDDFNKLGTLMWSTFHFPVDNEHRTYLEEKKADKDLDLFISCFSLFEHEARHFHDLLVTPYGSVLMRQYTRASLYYLFLNDELYFRTKSIFVPISEWVDNSLLLKKSFPNLDTPSKALKEYESIFRIMSDKIYAYNKGWINQRDETRFPDATSILEGSAILVQEMAIKQNFGQEYVDVFRKSIIDRGSYRKYYGSLDVISSVAKKPVAREVAAYILFACLCGNYQDPNPDRVQYPSDILAELLLWLDRHSFDWGASCDFEDTIDIIDQYYEETHGDDLFSMVTKGAVANKLVIEALEEELNHYEQLTGKPNKRGRIILDRFYNFCEVQGNLMGAILTNPYWYFSGAYLELQRNLPSPVIFIESNVGLPITEPIEEVFYIQAEDRIYLPNNSQFNYQGYTDSLGAIRAARILSPREKFYHQWPSVGEGSLWIAYLKDGPAIDVELWQKSHDLVAGFRFLLEGPNSGISSSTVRDVVSAFTMIGTDIYTDSGKIEGIMPDMKLFGNEADEILKTLRNIKKDKF